MKKAMVLLALVMAGLGLARGHAQDKPDYRHALSVHVDWWTLLIIPMPALAYEYMPAPRFSLFIPVSANLFWTPFFKLEVHPRWYLSGNTKRGFFVSPHLGMTWSPQAGSTLTGLAGATLGGKFTLGRRWFGSVYSGVSLLINERGVLVNPLLNLGLGIHF